MDLQDKTVPQRMNIGLLNTTVLLAFILLVGWLLYIGRNVLVPVVLAMVIWYVIDTMASGFQTLLVKRFALSHGWALVAALLVVVGFSLLAFDLIAANVVALSKDVPTYQIRIENKVNPILAHIAPGMTFEMDKLGELLNLKSLVGWVANVTSSFLSMSSLVLLYVIFFLIEQGVADAKFSALFPQTERHQAAASLRAHINRDIRTYLSIKTFASVLTGALSYVVLRLFEVDYPAFWGFLIFLLNYIPTIGSLIGVIFPALLALVQFDSYWPFFSVTAFLAIVQFAVGNILEPKLMGDRLNLSSLAILLALAIWGSLWGITGMILSVPLTVILMIIFSEYEQTRPIAILLSGNGKIGSRG